MRASTSYLSQPYELTLYGAWPPHRQSQSGEVHALKGHSLGLTEDCFAHDIHEVNRHGLTASDHEKRSPRSLVPGMGDGLADEMDHARGSRPFAVHRPRSVPGAGRIHASGSLCTHPRCCGQPLPVGPELSGVIDSALVSLCTILDMNFGEAPSSTHLGVEEGLVDLA